MCGMKCLIFLGFLCYYFHGRDAVDPPYNVPTCTPTFLQLNLSEATSVNTIILPAIGCTDADDPSTPEGTLQYEMFSGKAARFDVDTNTGAIRLKKKFNADFQKYYFVEVKVYDQGVPSQTAIVGVSIYLFSVNDNAPKITNLPASITVDEMSAPGTLVTGCTLSDKDSRSGGLAGEVRIDITGGDPYSKFWIDPQTCNIYVHKYLEYEKRNIFYLTFKATDLDPDIPKTATAQMTVYVADSNNFKPTCTDYLKLAYIPESTMTGSTITTLTCSDIDSGSLNVLSYTAVGGDMGILGVDGTSGEVTLISPVDYESGQVEYSLRIDVKDSGLIQYTASVEVKVAVTDVDDQDPVWTATSVFTANISEATPIGTVVLIPQAEDPDTDLTEPNFIMYGFDSPPLQPWFAINSRTGAVMVTAALDRETLPVVEFDITAYSSNNADKNITAHVTITLTDVNDEEPRFTLPVYAVTLPENSVSGSTAVTVIANDPDEGTGGQVEYSVDGSFFNIDVNSGIVTTTGILVTGTDHVARVTAVDKGVPSLTSQCMIVLTASPVNDYTPTFSPLPTQNIPEDTQPGTTVLQITATDADVGVDGDVVYSLQDPSVPFLIDSASGEIITRLNLDRETNSSWDVVAVATDKSTTSPKSSSVTVQFDITDVNDNVPICEPVITIMVTKPYTTGTTLTTLVCVDDDADVNAELIYTITAGDSGVFNVDAAGNLKLSATPTSSSYAVTVTATDKGTSPLSTQVPVLVFVELDLAFINLPASVNKSEDVSTGNQVMKVQACCSFRALVYEIVSGNTGDRFGIDEYSGQIYVLADLDREDVANFSIGIRVRTIDSSHSTDSLLDIILNDVNDNDPKFHQTLYIFELQDGVDVGTSVGTVNVSDLDIGTNAQIDLSIIGGNYGDVFELDGNTVKTKGAVDYTTQRQYTLNVQASDNGPTIRSSKTTVIINILPNLVVPEFGQNSVSITLDENTVVKTPITDFDATVNGVHEDDLVYSIQNGNTNSAFHIHESTGEVYIAGQLDFEAVQQYNLVILATGRDNSTSTDTITLDIPITNLNDNPPMFTMPVFEMTTPEGANVGTTVGQVVVSDGDEGTFGQVTMAMSPSSGSTDFNFDPVSGYLTVAVVTEYSRQAVYYMSIVATDGGSPARSSTAVVVIKVNDTNNHAPEFPETVYSFAVVETTPINDDVYTVRAADADGGLNAKVTYRITSGNGAGNFVLDAETGVLTIANTLDRETDDKYVLTVEASDGGSLSNAGSCSLNITVVDANDNSPRFSVSSIDKIVNRITDVGSIVATETATDEDAGTNGDVVYAVTSGNEEGVFVIGWKDGVLKMMISPTADLYTLTVTAKDGGVPSRTGQTTVTVRVTPIANSVTSTFDFSILENSAITSSVGEVTPHGSHAAGAVVTYSIASGNFDSLFAITKLPNGNGEITLTKQPDREIYSQYVLTVNELDDNSLSVDRIVKITILDENDNDPGFSTSTLNIKVVENSPAGLIVSTITATDPDEGTNGQITYSIPTSYVAANGLFQIDNSGVLTVKDPADFESNPVVNFAISATDGGGRSGEITLIVDIIDVNETVIETDTSGSSAFISTEVPDTAATGAVVTTLTLDAFGLNSAEINSVKYVTVSGGGVVSVNEGTGVVTVKDSGKLFKDTRYFEWVICQAVNATSGQSLAVLGLVRVDCFEATKHMIVITFGDTKDAIELNRLSVRAHIQSFFLPTQYAGIWEVRQEGSSSRRRLLAAQSSALVYVVADPSVNTLSGAQNPKQFLTQEAALQVLQLSSDGSPVAGLSSGVATVDQVMPYATGATSAAAVFTASTVGISVIALAAAVGLVILILIVICVIWRLKKKARKSLDISDEKPLSIENKKDKKPTAPLFRDVAPLPPITTIIPRSDLPNDAPIRNRKSTVDLPAITPAFVLSPNENPAPRFQKFEIDKLRAAPIIKSEGPTVGKSPPVNNPADKVLPREESVDDDGVSLVADDDITPHGLTVTPTHVRSRSGFQEQPILVGGKIFDGVGFDDATDKHYVYNTKTGEVSYDVDKNTNTSARSVSTSSSSPPSTPLRTIGSLPDLNTGKRPPEDTKPQHKTAQTSRHLGRRTGSFQDLSTAQKTSSSAFTGSIDSGIGEFSKQSDNSSVSSDDNATDSTPRYKGVVKHSSLYTSTIPKGSANRQDILSRDPLYYEWAKGIAKRGKRPRPSGSPTSESGDLPLISTQGWMK